MRRPIDRDWIAGIGCDATRPYRRPAGAGRVRVGTRRGRRDRRGARARPGRELRAPAVSTWKLRDGLIIEGKVHADVTCARAVLRQTSAAACRSASIERPRRRRRPSPSDLIRESPPEYQSGGVRRALADEAQRDATSKRRAWQRPQVGFVLGSTASMQHPRHPRQPRKPAGCSRRSCFRVHSLDSGSQPASIRSARQTCNGTKPTGFLSHGRRSPRVRRAS